MDIKRKTVLWLLFFLINSILLMFWGFLIFWLMKNYIIWNTVEFLLYFPLFIILVIIPCYFFLRSAKKLFKNLKLKERFKVSKRYVIPSLFIAGLVWSLSILAFILYAFPIARNYAYDDGPYLIWNDDPKTTMTIIWHTAEPAVTELKYGESSGNMETFKISILEKRHVAELKNLKPGTFYNYTIPNFSSNVYNFTTAPSSIIPFNFTVISDTHGAYANTKYGAIIDAMSNYTYNFILHAGDIANGDDAGYHKFFDLMERHASTRPYMIAIGNHEYGYADLDVFGRSFKYRFPYNYAEDWGHYYSFDYANAHFVMLDIFQNPFEWPGFLLEAQEAWLRADLAANRDKWLFVGLHEPIYSTGDYNMNLKTIAQLAPIFYENQVDVVFCGHDHHYESF